MGLKVSTSVIALLVMSICSALPAAAVGSAAAEPTQVAAPNAAPPAGLKGIWGAIAYSIEDGKHGFTWGAATSEDAQEDAAVHCERAGGSACKVVTTFRNHRRWEKNDDEEFPYLHCAALARDEASSAWGAAVAERRAPAEEEALKLCRSDAAEACKVVEWVCT